MTSEQYERWIATRFSEDPKAKESLLEILDQALQYVQPVETKHSLFRQLMVAKLILTTIAKVPDPIVALALTACINAQQKGLTLEEIVNFILPSDNTEAVTRKVLTL